MVNKDQISKIVKKRPKRVFSLEDKYRFYDLWKASGLNRTQFCKRHDLASSAFAKWCRELASKKDILPSQGDWVPVVSKNKILETAKDHSTIVEIKVSHATKICVFLLFVTLILREFLNAVNTIW